MTPHPVPSATRGLVRGLDVLLAALGVLAVVLAPPGRTLAAAGAGLVLAAVYVAGRLRVRVHERAVDDPRGAWWPDGAWMLALGVAWVALLWASPAALWLAFGLMLLQVHVLGPHRGVLAVAATTAVAVVDGLVVQAGPDDTWTGFVLGPVLGAAVAVAVVLGIEAFVREAQERQRTVEELTRARRHLARAERDRAVTDERARLARDIHDTLAQSLSAIELLLRAADDTVTTDPGRAQALLAQARAAARDGLAEARRVVDDLTPRDLDGTTLLAALRRVAERTAETAGPPGTLTVAVTTTGDVRALPVPQETALLRVAQSALANVAEHARAAHADVTLAYGPHDVTLEITDDGTGLPGPDAPADVRADTTPAGPGARGFGLPAIRSRADELGGTLTLGSGPLGGARVTVTLPAPGTEDAS